MNVDLKSAIDLRRVHHQLYPDYVQSEQGFNDDIIEILKQKGHLFKCFTFGGSIVQAVSVKDNLITAYSDPRKGKQIQLNFNQINEQKQ
jgi:gamma-glutamyltranspeptidase